MSQKNFIFLSNATGGIESFQINLINFLNENKFNTILIDKNKKIINKLKYKKFHKFYHCNVLMEFIRSIKILIKIKKQQNKDEFIFVISNTTIFSLYFILIKLLFKNTQILHFFHSHIYNINLIQLSAGFISSFFSIFSNKNIFVSNFTQNWWNNYFPLLRLGNQKVIKNFIKLPNRIYKNNYNKLNIGFIGRLEKEKGIEKFLKISKEINKRKINFYIFGNGSLKINKKKFKNLKIYSWSKKEIIYKKINVLFVTSKIENCPFTVIEAKAYGVPTITISQGGIGEIIKNYKDGIIINNKSSVKEIEKKFFFILKNYRFFEKNCLKNSKEFQLSNYKRKFLDVI